MLKKDTWNVFKGIVQSQAKGNIAITELGITRKRYYSSISQLMQLGLVNRIRGKYTATAFGIVIYNIQSNLEKTVQNALLEYWKLKALDSLVMPSREETGRIIRSLITNEEIRSLLSEEPKFGYQADYQIRKDRRPILVEPQFS